MSLTSAGSEPQPSLAWTFESSNVDYVTNLTPSSQVSPGPAQLQGGAALVTNAPTSNTAVYFPNSVNSYMNLGTSTPVNFSYATSNLFLEAWIYIPTLKNANMVGLHDTVPQRGKEYWNMYVDSIGFVTVVLWGVNGGVDQNFGKNLNTVSAQTWTHVSFSVAYDSVNTNYKLTVGINGTVSTATSPTGWTANTFYATGSTFIGGGGIYTTNMYIRDLRVVQGGVVPTTSFTPGAAPFSYASPGYVPNMGSTVFTLLGQFVTYVPGKFGSAIRIINNPIGGDSNVTSTRLMYTSSIQMTSSGGSLSCWIKFLGLPQGNDRCTPFFSHLSYVNIWGFNILQTGGYGSQTYNNFTPVVNTWYHFAQVWNGSVMVVYINGAVLGTSGIGSISTPVNAYVNITAEPVRPTSAEYDDLRIYNTALTAAQVQSIYTQGGAPASNFRSVPQPTLAWDFNGTTRDYIRGISSSNPFGLPNSNVIVSSNAIYNTGLHNLAINVYNTSTTFYGNVLMYQVTSVSSPFTISFWFKVNTVQAATGEQVVIFRAGTGFNFFFKFFVNTFGTQITSQTGVYDAAGGLVFPDTGFGNGMIFNYSGWNFYCLVVQPSLATVYVSNTTTSVIQTRSGAPTGTNLFTGLMSTFGTAYTEGITVTNRPFNGLIDDLRIYNTALSAAQVQSIYRAQGMPSRGRQVKTQVPVASMIGQTFTPLNISTNVPDTSVTGQITLTAAASNSTNQGKVYLTPSATGVSFSVVYMFNSPGVSSTGPVCFLSDAGDCLQLNMAFGTTSLVARKFLAGTACTFASTTVAEQGVRYYVTVVMEQTGYIYLYLNGVLVSTGNTDTVILPSTLYSVFLGRNRFGNLADITVWDFFVVNATLSASQVLSIYQNQLANINYNPGNMINWVPTRVSGTPLFSQLSQAATSSAVGAFSLRAVNGTTARAVQVRPVPAGASTPSAFSIIGNQFSQADQSLVPPDTSVTGQTSYNGTNQYTRINPLALTPATTGLTVSLAFKLNSRNNVLFKLNAPYPNVSIELVSDSSNIWFEEYNITAGSWARLGNVAYTTSTTVYMSIVISGTTAKTFVNNTLLYTSTLRGGMANGNYDLYGVGSWNGGGYANMTLYDFRIQNTSLPDSAFSSQDFYADRLGNLLTRPVTGQTLTNWLGNAQGYVTTWYDQSGRGNHASQTTAANQPIIQRATKGPGYATVFNGSQWVSYGTTSTFANTPFSVCVALRRSNGNNRNMWGGWGDTGSNIAWNANFITPADTIQLSNRGVNVNSTVPVWTSSEGMYYITHTLSNSYYANNYVNGAYSSQGYWGNFLNAATTNNAQIGRTTGAGTPNTFYGEIYELLVFTQSLYDLDGTTSINQIYQNQLSLYGA